ncbi:hypothetical protein [Telmatospirillum sp.]|uniref:hypothetical protein n=1 Tax=Telmatospirillum sp. TaxID=2079197 RepID=UPI00283BF849|nr:hypothetical protein [Telmatospirillum sp.]MDR3438923.1 hypothetical protein [Telmatospirillum sp.]
MSGVPALLWFVFLCAFFVSVIVFVGTARKMRQGVKRTYKVVDVKTKDAEIFPYIMAYIPPLIFRDISKPDIYLPLAVLYGMICLLYMRLDAPYLNPYFLLFGYRIFEAKLEPSRNVVTIIAHHRPISGLEELEMSELSAGAYYCE